jgi:MYXO-CTERM domain-containing protein
MRRGAPILLVTLASGVLVSRSAGAACPWGFPVGDDPTSPAPLADNHPVGGMNLPEFGAHLGADFWSGGGCTDLGRTVYAVADGEVVEIVDALGSYLDVVVIRHDDPDVGTVYSMYGHISRDDGLSEGDDVAFRQPIGEIADVLAYFSPCHLHFELLNEAAFAQGPFCSGCANAGYHVSPGYDQQVGVVEGQTRSGDPYLEVDDAIGDNRWYRVDEFLQARTDEQCGTCGDGVCGGGEDFDDCPDDCPPCAWIGPEGATFDDVGPCFTYGGDSTYWTVQNDAGHDGSLRWTHATDSEMVDNWGRWSFAFEEAGTYRVEVWIDDVWGMTQQAAYQLVNAGASSTIVLDQQAASGWASLGEHDFAAGGGQSLYLADNTGEPFAQMIPIAFDAVRLVRQGGGTEGGIDTTDAQTEGGSDGGSDLDGTAGVSLDGSGGSGGSVGGDPSGPALPPGARDDGGAGCGCAVTPWSGGPWSMSLLVVLAARRRRRATGG